MKETVMELLVIVTAVLTALIVFAALAMSLGADSRESIGDDWARPTHA